MSNGDEISSNQEKTEQRLKTYSISWVMEQTQTFVHKAKNKEIRRWASADETEVSDCAPFMESFSDVPGSENWEPLMDVSWLPL